MPADSLDALEGIARLLLAHIPVPRLQYIQIHANGWWSANNERYAVLVVCTSVPGTRYVRIVNESMQTARSLLVCCLFFQTEIACPASDPSFFMTADGSFFYGDVCLLLATFLRLNPAAVVLVRGT